MAGWGGRRAQAYTRLVLATYGTVCHLCGHEAADSADHLKPRVSHPELMYALDNGRPAHHRPCPTCGVRCNTRRGCRPITSPGGVFPGGVLVDGTAYVD